MRNYERFWIDGEWQAPSSSDTLDVVHVTTEAVMGRVPAGQAEDADRAVAAARRAFHGWSMTSPAERAAALTRLADGLEARQDELGDLIAQEVGMPVVMARAVQVGLPITVLRTYAKMVTEFAFQEEIGNSLVVREPVGVVGCITPWNYPLHQIVAKVAAALAAGCTVVLKPSEVAPLNAFAFAEIVEKAELPAGVFNLITGLGSVVGEAIVAHPEVDMVSFTGSTQAGKRVAVVAAETVKRVAQELGGKSANVILDDADLTRAVRTGVNNCYFNSGQTCSAWTRMLVPRQRQDEVIEIAKATAERLRLGDPMEPGTKLGPLVSDAQRARVRAYIEKGIEEGAQLVTGGAEAPDDLPAGFFVQPTIFADVRSDMTIAREEIFGPVLAIMPYDDEEEAIRLANDTPYGLAGAVWSDDAARAERVALRLRTGQVDINGGRYNPLAPFGGYKQSGNGREMGRYGLEEYLEIKSLQR